MKGRCQYSTEIVKLPGNVNDRGIPHEGPGTSRDVVLKAPGQSDNPAILLGAGEDLQRPGNDVFLATKKTVILHLNFTFFSGCLPQ